MKGRPSVEIMCDNCRLIQVPPIFDSYDEMRDATIEFRSGLQRVVKLAAALLPEHALQVKFRIKRIGLRTEGGDSGLRIVL